MTGDYLEHPTIFGKCGRKKTWTKPCSDYRIRPCFVAYWFIDLSYKRLMLAKSDEPLGDAFGRLGPWGKIQNDMKKTLGFPQKESIDIKQ